jgi:ankyrin repeat protein
MACLVAGMAPWVPLVVVLFLVVAGIVAARSLLAVISLLRRRIRTRSPRTSIHPDWAFYNATKLIKYGDIVVLRREFASGLNSNLRDKYGNDFLMIAARLGNVAVGELLIANGADVNYVSPSGYAAVWAAFHGGHVRFLKLLFKSGADPDRVWGRRTIEEALARCQLDAKKAEAIRLLLRECGRSLK